MTYVFINGILNFPGASDNWTDRGVTWVQTKTEHRAEKFEYLCFVVSRRLSLDRWAKNLSALVAHYAGRDIALVAHSNGCELVCRMLQISGVHIRRVHLISGACSPDFYKNGLNEALRENRVGEVVVHVAEKDLPMRIANVSRYLIGWLGLGYGTLGLNGPTNIDPAVQERVTVVREPNFGHSTWFEPQHFDDLMMTVTGVIAFENHSQDVSDDSKTGNSSEGDWSD
jgi:pimeloyl-ACP methyl ester carboxylesterase